MKTYVSWGVTFSMFTIACGRTPQNLSFKYNGSEIEVVKNFNYLGIIFSKTGNFNLANKRSVDKAVVSMYEVLKLGRKYNLSIKCLLSFR